MNIKNKKVNFLAIIGMMMAFGTFAFTSPKESENNAPLYWYMRVDASTYTDALPDEELECPDTGDFICALGFKEEQVAGDLDDNSISAAKVAIKKSEE